MRNLAKKRKNILDIDGRGRITLPKELREGVDSFTVKLLKGGTLQLVPQQVVSTEEARLAQILKSSVDDFKAGRIKKIPQSWLANDDEEL
ncbi:MAG: hypothetical protein ABL927_12280 [Bdellovibrionales bacterium]